MLGVRVAVAAVVNLLGDLDERVVKVVLDSFPEATG